MPEFWLVLAVHWKVSQPLSTKKARHLEATHFLILAEDAGAQPNSAILSLNSAKILHSAMLSHFQPNLSHFQPSY